VMVQAQREAIADLGDKLVNVNGVTEVYSVTGRYDFVIIVRLSNHDALADVVTRELLAIPGIASTETLVAFKCYSNYDLERMFSIGFNGEPK